MPNIFLIMIVCFTLLGFVLFLTTAAALRKKKILLSLFRLLLALLALAAACLLGMLVIATAGYRALTHEERAAFVRIEPIGAKDFRASFIFPDGQEASYRLTGDALYVDAHILKWKPLVNMLGLHTAYELDRVAGRYIDVKEERESIRTVFPLRRKKPLNMFTLRQRYSFLMPLLDAEYGSASFINSGQPAYYEIRVSTTGLLIRKVGNEAFMAGTKGHGSYKGSGLEK